MCQYDVSGTEKEVPTLKDSSSGWRNKYQEGSECYLAISSFLPPATTTKTTTRACSRRGPIKWEQKLASGAQQVAPHSLIAWPRAQRKSCCTGESGTALGRQKGHQPLAGRRSEGAAAFSIRGASAQNLSARPAQVAQTGATCSAHAPTNETDDLLRLLRCATAAGRIQRSGNRCRSRSLLLGPTESIAPCSQRVATGPTTSSDSKPLDTTRRASSSLKFIARGGCGRAASRPTRSPVQRQL